MDSYFHAHRRNIYKGQAASHVDYITRQGRHKGRGDLVAVFALNMPPGVDSPNELFRLADQYERSRGIAAKEWEVSQPREFNNQQGTEAALDTAQGLLGKKPGVLAIHDSPASDGGRNLHFHLVFTGRMPDQHPRAPEKIFRRYNSQDPLNGGWKKEREATSKVGMAVKLKGDRLMIERKINEHLARHGVNRTVDSRSFKEQGIDKAPGRHLYARGIREKNEKVPGN